MSQVLIVVDSSGEEIPESKTTLCMVSAVEQAIATSATAISSVQVIAANLLQDTVGVSQAGESRWAQNWNFNDFLVCPLTLNVPLNLPFSAIYKACRDVPGLRQRVAQQLEYADTDGCFWLPVVLTAKGPLYGEVIAIAGEAARNKPLLDLSLCDLSYYQPFHLSDEKRQQVYQLGYSLLQLLSAPAASYLVQFGFKGSEICFDRLWPFPSAPAIASLGVQTPDLFACHWYCLTSQPILDLTIIPPLASLALP